MEYHYQTEKVFEGMSYWIAPKLLTFALIIYSVLEAIATIVRKIRKGEN